MVSPFETRHAPASIKLFVPFEWVEKMLPGTANTSLFSLNAKFAVMRLPLYDTHSMTESSDDTITVWKMEF